MKVISSLCSFVMSTRNSVCVCHLSPDGARSNEMSLLDGWSPRKYIILIKIFPSYQSVETNTPRGTYANMQTDHILFLVALTSLNNK